jgi:hypothetical protein
MSLVELTAAGVGEIDGAKSRCQTVEYLAQMFVLWIAPELIQYRAQIAHGYFA